MPTASEFAAKILVGDADLDRLNSAVNDAPGTFTTDEGVVVDNLRKRLQDIGYKPPVAFTSGLEPQDGSFTVTYNGLVYAADPTSTPFTTTGTFVPGEWVLIFKVSAFNDISDMIDNASTDHLSTGDVVRAGVYYFEVVAPGTSYGASGYHLATTGGVLLKAMPAQDGFCHFEQFGGVYADRSAAATNGAAINVAFEYCGLNGLSFDFGEGIIFNSVALTLSHAISVRGSDRVDEWSKWMTASQGRAGTEIVMTGTGASDQTVHGVSSMHNWGAGRTNPSSRTGTHNDAEYRLLSFVEENTLVTGRTLKTFSAAFKIEGTASGARLEGFRVLPDYGGTEGYDGYTDTYGNTVGVTSYPLTDGVWDVGLFMDNTRSVLLDRVQFVGQWRMAGLLGIAHARENPAGFYKNSFVDCTFTGYHGVEIRSADGAPVVASTTTTIDIPWSDDHPFGADGNSELAITTGTWPSDSDLYTFTGMQKITGGSYDILRITGISPNVPGGATTAYPYAKGGGTSHTSFLRGEIAGFQHPSREPCHIRGLAGVTDGVFEYPGGCLFISGTKATEIDLNRTSLTGVEEVAVHVHDCRNFSFDGYVEINRGAAGGTSRGGRVIFSPPQLTNTHSLAGFAAAGTLRPVWVHRGSTLNDGTLDTRPALPYIDATDFTDGSDVGFMEAFYLHAPLDPGINGNVSEGAALVSVPGGRAGLARRTAKPPFSAPSEDEPDWAFYLDHDDNAVRVRKNFRANTAGQAQMGSLGSGAFSAVVGQRFRSFSQIIADDTAFAFDDVWSKGGFVYVIWEADGNFPFYSHSGHAFFDVGSSPFATKLNGGGNFDVVSTDLTGTTGTDGNVTLGVKSGSLVLENRQGGSATFTLVVIG